MIQGLSLRAKRSNLLAFFLCVSLTGCTLMPGYHRPGPVIPAQWPASSVLAKIQTGGPTALDLISFKEFFNDPRLYQLIELALENNRDLRVAALNVELLSAEYRIGQAQGFPQINGTANGLQQKALTLGGGDTVKSRSYSLNLGVTSYELDLWGHVRSLKKEALENYFASQEARRSAQISLVAQVAIQYFTERALQEELITALQTLKSAESYAGLIKASYDLGNASELDLQSTQVQVFSARTAVFSYQRQHIQAENALALLIGQALPSGLPAPKLFNEEKVMSDIPAGLPSDLMERRPDILEAEHQLKAANANIGAARSAFFPKILLTGSGGIATARLTDLFTGSSVWSFAPQISVPVFDAGANKASLDVAKISKSIQVAQYEKAIQTAFQEVANALTARSMYNDQADAQEALVKAQRQRYDLADIRYRNGIESYLTVLTAQQDLYAAEQNLTQLKLAKLANLITLYKALGGGWQEK